jgi:hypothetical protein
MPVAPASLLLGKQGKFGATDGVIKSGDARARIL